MKQDTLQAFAEWIQAELDERGWSRSQAARRGGISASMFNKVINEHANPGLDFCLAVATAFRISPEQVLRKAGLLPPISDDAIVHGIIEVINYLDDQDQTTVLEVARALHLSKRERDSE